MTKKAKYTVEQLGSAERMAKTLFNIPKEKRILVVMMANAFMAGMEAQENANKI